MAREKEARAISVMTLDHGGRAAHSRHGILVYDNFAGSLLDHDFLGNPLDRLDTTAKASRQTQQSEANRRNFQLTHITSN